MVARMTATPQMMFNAGLSDKGLPVVRLEFPDGFGVDRMAETAKRVMTNMVGDFDDQDYSTGRLHAVFADGCCADVMTKANLDGSFDVIWAFHKAPEPSSKLMELLAGGVDRKAAN